MLCLSFDVFIPQVYQEICCSSCVQFFRKHLFGRRQRYANLLTVQDCFQRWIWQSDFTFLHGSNDPWRGWEGKLSKKETWRKWHVVLSVGRVISYCYLYTITLLPINIAIELLAKCSKVLKLPWLAEQLEKIESLRYRHHLSIILIQLIKRLQWKERKFRVNPWLVLCCFFTVSKRIKVSCWLLCDRVAQEQSFVYMHARIVWSSVKKFWKFFCMRSIIRHYVWVYCPPWTSSRR